MPKSSGAKRKAKNAGVGIDFKKAKHRVGKKLPKAQNATDTNFKSKAITLPGQNVGEDKGAAVSQGNLTLKVLYTCMQLHTLFQRVQIGIKYAIHTNPGVLCS